MGIELALLLVQSLIWFVAGVFVGVLWKEAKDDASYSRVRK